MMNIQYFIFAGEKSGDLHGSRLIQSLRIATSFSTDFIGVGGPSMRAEGLKCILPMEDFQVMGFSDVFKSLPKLWKQFYIVLEAILKVKPDCVILIDYPGFNLRLARALRRKGFIGKIVQYICPTVWAHGAKRIKTMSQTLNLLLTIYPFESIYFNHTSLPVKYVGNPLVEIIQKHVYDSQWQQKTQLPPSQSRLAIFPGSRLGEIQQNLPQQLIIANMLKKDRPDIQFAISYAQNDLLPFIKNIIQQSSLKINQDIYLVPQQFTYELMRDCHTALSKSGTTTLELAFHHRPSLVIYQLSQLNYFIAKYILRLRLPHYCLVNILGDEEIFPEFIGRKIDIQQLYYQLKLLHEDEEMRTKTLKGCQKVQTLLGSFQSNEIAAQAIKELLRC